MTFGSLFAGVGGLDLGLERAGFACRWQVEINPFSRAVLAAHWPNVPRFEDVRRVGAHNLEPVDLICGGFPCQDISNAGKRIGITGKRSGLWTEYARIVRELQPRLVLVENVAALVVRGLDVVLGDLAALGFDAEWDVLRASDVGAPHRRARLFLVADRRLADTDGGRRGVVGLAQPAGLESARRDLVDGSSTPRRELDAAPGMADAASVRRWEGAAAATEEGSNDAGSERTGIVSGRSERRSRRDGGAAHLADAASGGQRINGRAPRQSGHADERDPVVADADRPGSKRADDGRRQARRLARRDGGQPLADAGGDGLQGLIFGRAETRHALECVGAGSRWPSGPGEPQHEWEPGRVIAPRSALGRVPHGISADVVRARAAAPRPIRHRRAQLEALGNAVVPQLAEALGRRILEVFT